MANREEGEGAGWTVAALCQIYWFFCFAVAFKLARAQWNKTPRAKEDTRTLIIEHEEDYSLFELPHRYTPKRKLMYFILAHETYQWIALIAFSPSLAWYKRTDTTYVARALAGDLWWGDSHLALLGLFTIIYSLAYFIIPWSRMRGLAGDWLGPIFFDLLAIPYMQMCFGFLTCEYSPSGNTGYLVKDSDLKCWNGDHIGYTFLAMLEIGLFLPAGLAYQLYLKPASQQKVHTDVRFNVVYFLFKVWMVAAITMLELFPDIFLPLSMVIMAAAITLHMNWQPACGRGSNYNNARTGMFAAALYATMAGMGVRAWDDDETVTPIVLLITLLLPIYVCLFWVNHLFSDPKTVPNEPLLHLVNHPESTTRITVTNAMLDVMKAWPDGRVHDMRVEIANDKAFYPRMMSLLTDNDSEVRHNAAQILGQVTNLSENFDFVSDTLDCYARMLDVEQSANTLREVCYSINMLFFGWYDHNRTRIAIAIATRDLLPRLVHLLHEVPETRAPALRVLRNVSRCTEGKVAIVSDGELGELLKFCGVAHHVSALEHMEDDYAICKDIVRNLCSLPRLLPIVRQGISLKLVDSELKRWRERGLELGAMIDREHAEADHEAFYAAVEDEGADDYAYMLQQQSQQQQQQQQGYALQPAQPQQGYAMQPADGGMYGSGVGAGSFAQSSFIV